MINGYLLTTTLLAGHRLNIFQLIKTKPRTEADLFTLTKTKDVHRLRAILYFLTTSQIISFENDFYVSNDLTSYLGDKSKPYLYLLELIGEQYLPAMLQLDQGVKNELTAFELKFGESPWEQRSNNPKLEEIFQQWLFLETNLNSQILISEWDWSAYPSIIDIGSGNGALAYNIISNNPQIKVSIFDTPSVIENLIDQGTYTTLFSQFIAGDFFKEVPLGYSAYLLKSVLHDWNDENSIQILKKVKDVSIQSNGKIIIIERLLPFPDVRRSPYETSIYELNLLMSSIHGSHERSESEFLELFVKSGLKVVNQKSLSNGFFLFELA